MNKMSWSGKCLLKQTTDMELATTELLILCSLHYRGGNQWLRQIKRTYSIFSVNGQGEAMVIKLLPSPLSFDHKDGNGALNFAFLSELPKHPFCWDLVKNGVLTVESSHKLS